MKTRFSTLDVMAIVPQLHSSYSGMRVTQVYDLDSKTYLLKLSRTATENNSEQSIKQMILLESGIRIHSTEYDWPKNNNPNGFTMKLRKHLKNKRLEYIKQLGVDRVIDLQFGTNEASYHLIVELYDRGNIVITDHTFLILNILRPRKLGVDDDVKLVVREKYPIDCANSSQILKPLSVEALNDIINNAKDGDNLKKVLNPHTIYGSALIEHSLISAGYDNTLKLNKQSVDIDLIENAMKSAHDIMLNISNSSKGFIIQRVEKRIGEPNCDVTTYLEFHPILFIQHKNNKDPKVDFMEVSSFDTAVDQFFSSIESQKIDSKALHQEKEAMKKLENIKKDHQKRIENLNRLQEADIRKAELIEANSDLVEKALLVLRSAIANQFSWNSIQELIDDAKALNDPIATRIVSLKLSKNNFTMKLNDPYEDNDSFELIDIDIDLSAHSNARKYYDNKRTAAKKEQKTIESSEKAYKNAEKKAKQLLKEVAVKTNITKARKILWFEKFFWFISSENYLVIAGRDAQQNEMIVKRYMKPNDVYVHADLHGATSVLIKNHNPLLTIPPKTLNEAGDMAVCYSTAWDAKIITSAWWVSPNQVSKTAPSGEYLTVGSFMIRGKKNYLSLSHLVMGFGFVFKLDPESTEKHRTERKSISLNSDTSLSIDSINLADDEEIIIQSESESSSDSESVKFPDTTHKIAINTNDISDAVNQVVTQLEESSDNCTIVESKAPRIKTQKFKVKLHKHNNTVNTEIKEEDTNIDKLSDQTDKQQPLKRGQKSKLKKIKEKYKDQDEEERSLRMAILGHKNSKKNQKLVKDSVNNQHNKITKQTNTKKKIENVAQNAIKSIIVDNESTDNLKSNVNDGNENEENENENDEHNEQQDDEDVGIGRSDDIALIESLTGEPFSDDNILYAIPVCAPYSAMHNYKYKVKVLPGTNRRGKAAKTALQLFIREKTATEREKDVLKVQKDQDISKNMPAKVKIAASNLIAIKSKK